MTNPTPTEADEPNASDRANAERAWIKYYLDSSMTAKTGMRLSSMYARLEAEKRVAELLQRVKMAFESHLHVEDQEDIYQAVLAALRSEQP